MKRAIIYARVSTDPQARDGYSLATQIDAMREYAAKFGFEIVGEFSDDISGSLPVSERPEGRKVYDLMRQKRIDAVILYTIDRAARDEDVLEFGIFKRDCKRAGVELHFVDTGKVSDSIMGGLMEQFKAAAASEERLKIKERTSRGRIAKAKAGKWVGHAKPYGYKKVGLLKESRLEVDPETSKIVRRMFDMAVGSGVFKPTGVSKIAAALSREGILTPYGNQIWRTASIYVILKNPIYVGRVKYKGHEAYLPEIAFIPCDLFEAVQVKLKENKHYGPRNRKRVYLLAGRFKCICGCSRIGLSNQKNGKLYLSYQCSDKPYSHYLGCVEKNIRAETVETKVWDKLISEFNEETILAGVRARREKQEQELTPKRERVLSILEEIERDEARISKLMQAFAGCEDDDVSAEYQRGITNTTRHRNALRIELADLEKEIESLEAGLGDEEYIVETVRAVKQKLEGGANPTPAQKRAMIEMLDVKCQLVRENGHLGVSVTYILKSDPISINLDPNYSPIEIKSSQTN